MVDLTPPRRDEDLVENGSKPTLRLARWMELVSRQFSSQNDDAVVNRNAVQEEIRSDSRLSRALAQINELEKRIECLEQFNGR